MAQRKKQWKKRKHPSCFLFTTATIDITMQGLQRFEQVLQRADHQNEKVVFAEKTVRQIKARLVAMQRSASLTVFDYNERVILTQAIRMYMLEVAIASQTTENARTLVVCRKLIAYFSVT
ncbi:MAG TPA: hypothetical protein VFB12_27870 [Ktedonobacteraceae bacterium]|nr:hypothetical protein [Ktedonobacteraceae bacterium]